MQIWNIAVDNRVTIYIVMASIIVLGWGAYVGLPREASPDVSIPIVIVTTPYIGVSPSDIEALVSQPLERNLKSLKDIKQITSASKEGLSTVKVEFSIGVDIDDAVRRVRDEVSSSRSELPNDILDPIVTEINLSEFPILYVNIRGAMGIARLKEIGKDLKEQCEAVPGVLRAELVGGLEPEVQVNCDVDLLNGYRVSFEDVVNAIRAENVSIPGGLIDNQQVTLSVRVPGEFKQVRPLEDVIVRLQNGKPIYVRDVATVTYAFEDRKTHSRLNDEEVVTLTVSKRAGENLLEIAERVKRIVDEARPRLPVGVELVVSNDQSVTVNRMVHELENSIMTGMVLVVLLLFMFFGFKNAMLIATAIPFSMFLGFIALSLSNITLNVVVLFSLVLVLGIVVDDAIVVIENIYRHQQEYNQDPTVAAKLATAEVALPVLTSTLTTLAAFVPLLFWPGIVGDFMKYLPITLICTMLGSLFVAYVISPVQGAQWINYRRGIAKARENLEHPHWYKKYNPFTIVYHKVDEKFFPWMIVRYSAALLWALKHRGITVAGSLVFLVVVIILFGLFSKGVVFFPDVQPSMVNVSIVAAPGTSLAVTNNIGKDLERRLSSVPGRRDIEFVVANIGSSDDPFDFGGQGVSNKGRIALNFYQKALRSQSTFVTLQEVRDSVQGVRGADIKVTKQQMGPPVGAPISVEVAGDDYSTLAALTEKVKARMSAVAGLVDLRDNYNTGKPEVVVEVDREKAAMLGMSTAQIAGTVRSAISGAEASKYRVGEDEYKIRVRLKEDQRLSATALQNLNITFMNKQGKLLSIPLVTVATIRRTSGLVDIQRKDQKRVITITADAGGRLASDVLKDVRTTLEKVQLSAGYTIRYTGQDEEQKKASDFLTRAFLITLLLVFLILVSEFNSVRVPFVIMLSVLLSLIGVLIGLLVTFTPFSVVMTGVGVVSLAGIVVKNAIVLLDFMKHLSDKGLTLEQSLLEAGRTRLRPVLLTAATTVFGVVPLATGIDFDWRALHFVIGAESADFWRPLGVAIIFGLTVSTFLTLVVVPAFYALLEDWMQTLTRRFRRVSGRPIGGRLD